MESDASMWTGLWPELGFAGNSTFEMIWIAISFGGQALFGGRLLVQWLASERRGQSIIPVSFWYLSLIGGIILVIYAVHRRDPVFFFGQLVGVGRGIHLHPQSALDFAPAPGGIGKRL